MILIVAMGSAWAIEKGDRLLVKIPCDQKLFLEETFSKAVIMGRKTFLDLPGQQLLYGRYSIMLSQSPEFVPEGMTTCRSIGEVLREVRELSGDEVFVCGGKSIYRDFPPYVDSVGIVKIDYLYNGGCSFPSLDRDPERELTRKNEEGIYFDLPFSFCRYKRKSSGTRTE